jgi:hypothetical protein
MTTLAQMLGGFVVVARYEGTLDDLRQHRLDQALRRFGVGVYDREFPFGVGDVLHLRHEGRLDILVDDHERATRLAAELREMGMSVEIQTLAQWAEDESDDEDEDEDYDYDDADEEE